MLTLEDFFSGGWMSRPEDPTVEEAGEFKSVTTFEALLLNLNTCKLRQVHFSVVLPILHGKYFSLVIEMQRVMITQAAHTNSRVDRVCPLGARFVPRASDK